jgi:SPX domain protein involved in polyphosphate accumulation
VQKEFLRVEKFANVNTTACYKILKKHDKLIPATVCCRYYMERLHASPWVTRDHRCGAFPLNTFRLPDCPYESEVYYW